MSILKDQPRAVTNGGDLIKKLQRLDDHADKTGITDNGKWFNVYSEQGMFTFSSSSDSGCIEITFVPDPSHDMYKSKKEHTESYQLKRIADAVEANFSKSETLRGKIKPSQNH